MHLTSLINFLVLVCLVITIFVVGLLFFLFPLKLAHKLRFKNLLKNYSLRVRIAYEPQGEPRQWTIIAVRIWGVIFMAMAIFAAINILITLFKYPLH